MPFHNGNSSDKVMSYLHLHVLRKFHYIISGNQFIVHIVVISFMEEILSPKNKAPSCGSVLANFSSGMEKISLLILEDEAVITLTHPYF